MKVLGWIIGVLLLIIVGIGVYVVMNSGSLLERAIESYGSSYLGAPVEVENVAVSFGEGSAGIAGLQVGNPPGFSGAPAFRIASVDVDLDTEQLSSELVVLQNVAIDGAALAVIMKGREMNLEALMENLDSGAEAEASAEETGASSETQFIIDKFSFTNATASVDSDLLGQTSLEIPDIHLTGIGRQSNGVTAAEALQQILGPVYRSVSRELLERGVDVDGARDKLEGKLREKATDGLGEGLQRLREQLGPSR